MGAPTNEQNMRWRNANRVRYREISRAWWQRRRDDVITGMGGVCSSCGNNDIRVLTIDHVHGGGNEHRKTVGHSLLYRQLMDGSYTGPELQLLCANCHAIKSYNRKET